ncbi:PD-(D/E)XK nuclease family protein [Niallia alba]|uniref:RecB family exonuclease n=1 Tax=Niallia alba TaxID=2729105 RepID=UPI002E23DA0A|nr:PD-(D/E)XK nuclease family protein [Niallia alba]
MSSRPKLVIPKRYKEKYGEKFPIWSFSRINTLHNCEHEYYLSRIKKMKSLDNIYSLCGSYAHEILEKYYCNEIKYQDMVVKFESDFLDVEISDYKFSNDKEKNNKMRDKYKECVVHFFKTHNKMADKVAIEKLIWIDIEGNVFIGYVDAIHKDEDGNFIITDFKTSSMYKGKKVQEHGKQLLLYALGLIQGGVDINKIKVRWNFLKYVNISYLQKNGKMKTTSGDRNNWVKSIKTPLKRDIRDFYDMDEWEVDLKIEECIRNNSLASLDNSIIGKYKLEDCYVYPEVNQESIVDLVDGLISDINLIKSKGDDEVNWERNEIQSQDEYYCNVLCGVKKHCKYYKDYLNKKNLSDVEEEDIIALLEEI